MKEKNKYNVLVLGGDGMAGSMIYTYLKERGHKVFLTTRRKNTTNKTRFYFDPKDDIRGIDNTIKNTNPRYVINCIGMLNKAAEDNVSDAILINSYLPHYVNDLSSEYKFKFIHISTDCVFSGDDGGYKENSLPDATSYYGRTKALGEVDNSKSLTFRTSIVGPDPNTKGIGLFNWFMAQSGEITGFKKAIWSGVTTLQLAKSIEESFGKEVAGLYHLVNNKNIDKYNLLELFKEAMDKNITIKPSSDYVNDKSIVNTRKDYEFNVPSYKTMVYEMKDWINAHKDMYNNILEIPKEK